MNDIARTPQFARLAYRSSLLFAHDDRPTAMWWCCRGAAVTLPGCSSLRSSAPQLA